MGDDARGGWRSHFLDGVFTHSGERGRGSRRGKKEGGPAIRGWREELAMVWVSNIAREIVAVEPQGGAGRRRGVRLDGRDKKKAGALSRNL